MTKKQIAIAVGCRKGGTGKTTVTTGLASIFESAGLKTLVVDLDPQGNATTALGGDIEGATTAELLLNKRPVPQEIAENLYLFAGSSELLENTVRDVHPDELKYQSSQMPFDVVIYDCPPGSVSLERFATAASDVALITVIAHDLALNGGIALYQSFQEDRERRRPSPAHIAWVANHIDTRRKDDRDISEGLENIDSTVPVFEIRVDTHLKKITAHAAPRLMNATPTSNGAIDLVAISEWILKWR